MPVPEGGEEPSDGLGVWNDVETLRILVHPLRLRAYLEAIREPVSAKDLAARLDVPLPRISYHVRLLADNGLLRVVSRTPRRGAVETHYRAVATLDISDEAMRASPESWALVVQMLLRTFAEDAQHAVEQGAAAEPDFTVARAHFAVDAEGRRRLAQEVLDFYDRLDALERELRVEPGPGTQEVNVALVLYPGARAGGRNGPTFSRPDADRPTIPEA